MACVTSIRFKVRVCDLCVVQGQSVLTCEGCKYGLRDLCVVQGQVLQVGGCLLAVADDTCICYYGILQHQGHQAPEF